MGDGRGTRSATEQALWDELVEVRKQGLWKFRARRTPTLARLCGPPASGEPPEAPIRTRLRDLLDPPPRDPGGRLLARVPLDRRARTDRGLFGRVLFGDAAQLTVRDGKEARTFDSRARSVGSRREDLAWLLGLAPDTIRRTPKANEPRGGEEYRLMCDVVDALVRADRADRAVVPAEPPSAAPEPPPVPPWLVFGGIAAVAVLALVLVLFNTGTPKARARTQTGCAVFESSSASTREQESRLSAFAQLAREIGSTGSGRVCVVMAGRRRPDQTAAWIDVGPPRDPSLNTVLRDALVARRVRQVIAFTRPTLGISSPTRGSAVVEASTVAARELRPGDVLLILSGGVQLSPETGDFRTRDLSPPALARLLERMTRDGLVPDLRGVEVRMPTLQLVADGEGPPSQQQVQGIRRFWEAWTQEAGASLVTKD